MQKENEKKATTSQIGLFDLGHHDTEHLRFSLEQATPMTFEQCIRGEKQSVGYCISGHGLDGLKTYIDKRTVGREHVIAWKKKIAEKVVIEGEETIKPKTEGETKAKKEAMKRVRFIGLITNVRHVQTKTGKMMAIALCDSSDFRFSLLVFSKEYEALSPLLEEDKIVLVEGAFRGNEENGEISVSAQTIRASTITSIRQQAKDMNLFDPKAFVNLSGYDDD